MVLVSRSTRIALTASLLLAWQVAAGEAAEGSGGDSTPASKRAFSHEPDFAISVSPDLVAVCPGLEQSADSDLRDGKERVRRRNRGQRGGVAEATSLSQWPPSP